MREIVENTIITFMLHARKIALFSILNLFFGTVIWAGAKPVLTATSNTSAQKHVLSLKLAHACVYGKKREVQAFLNDGANPDARDSSTGNPAIFLAMRNADHVLVPQLLKADADVKIHRDSTNTTPLMYAAAFLDAKMIQILLKNGAKLEMKDSNGGTALSRAANSCGVCGCDTNEEAGLVLIKQGANVDARDNKGNTPLMLLAMDPDEGAVEMAKALLAKGAHANLKNKDSKTALQIARKSGGIASTELVSLLTSH
jgi:ankyrin repeat protein